MCGTMKKRWLMPSHLCAPSVADRIVSCYIYSMTITQTVEIPADGRRTIDIPREIPSGRVILTFTPYGENKNEFKDFLSVSNSTLDFWDNEDDEVWNNV